jgi:hypothetical protein
MPPKPHGTVRTCQLQGWVVHLLLDRCVDWLEVADKESADVDKCAQAPHLAGQVQQCTGGIKVAPVSGNTADSQADKGHNRCDCRTVWYMVHAVSHHMEMSVATDLQLRAR